MYLSFNGTFVCTSHAVKVLPSVLEAILKDTSSHFSSSSQCKDLKNPFSFVIKHILETLCYR